MIHLAAIDSTTERVVSLTVATTIVDRLRLGQVADSDGGQPRRRKTSVSTLYRWSTVGCRGVTLESIQIGATRCTSREALQRFFERLSAVELGNPAKTSRVEPRRARLSEAAGKALELRGA